MKLVLYSGGFGRENRELAAKVGELLENHPSPVITFVPGYHEDAGEDFRDFKRNLKGSGVKKFRCIPVDQPLSQQAEELLFTSDAIFLGGGNTFYILRHLKRRHLLAKFRAYVREGGLLLGLSAGSILMTPNVMTAQVPSLDADENESGLKDLRALGLVPFEFSPHYRASRRVDRELLDHSLRSHRPIYACRDGEGIVVREEKIQFVGNVTVFHRGFKYSLQ